MSGWHVDPATWQAYAAGHLDMAAQAAVETHVTTCPACRDSARRVAEDDPMTGGYEPVWEAVHAAIGAPRQPAHLRWLRRVGVPDDAVVVLAAAGDLRLPWALAVGGAVLSAVVAAHVARAELAYLLLAPLVPLLAVAAAFEATDPLRELAAPTPFSKLRLALLRTAATLAVAVPATALVGVVVPVLHALACVWLLPALCLSGAALVLLTRLPARWACGVAGAGWAAVVLGLESSGHLGAVTGGVGQTAFALVATALGVVLVRATTTLQAMGATR
ncbi:MAG: zf-HC2 domain-containing protein [Promicromonosporaceae bacterium]|nr:zf-HC2 domain-containing protein [Promicromonosporaceae bacterium]